MSRRRGRTLSNTSRDPPTMMDSRPSSSVETLPDTGASSISAPRSRTRVARARLSAGLTVLMSTYTAPGASPARMPSAPRGVGAHSIPASRSQRALDAVRLYPVTRWPASRSRLAIRLPMTPRPTNPTLATAPSPRTGVPAPRPWDIRSRGHAYPLRLFEAAGEGPSPLPSRPPSPSCQPSGRPGTAPPAPDPGSEEVLGHEVGHEGAVLVGDVIAHVVALRVAHPPLGAPRTLVGPVGILGRDEGILRAVDHQQGRGDPVGAVGQGGPPALGDEVLPVPGPPDVQPPRQVKPPVEMPLRGAVEAPAGRDGA